MNDSKLNRSERGDLRDFGIHKKFQCTWMHGEALKLWFRLLKYNKSRYEEKQDIDLEFDIFL